MMKIYFEAHGCSMNYGEAKIMEDIVSGEHEIVKGVGDADVIVLSTCIVIESTERRMINKIKRFSATGKKLVVAGCMASAEKEKILTTEFGKNNTVVGRTNAYRPVVIKNKINVGRFIDVKITGSGNTYLKGIIKQN